MKSLNATLNTADALEADGWIPVTDHLPATDKMVWVRQDQWAPCSAWRNERGDWKYIEYQHPHPVTH